jgi:PqqD family protein of HPr-rel-A system
LTAPIKPKVRDDIAAAELDGEAVLYDERTGELHHLNPTATIIFSMCDGTSTIREMSGEISGAFGMASDEVERQVRVLLRQFRKGGLLNGA